MVRKRLKYYRRLVGSYLGKGSSQLTFWWERPEVHPDITPDALGPYYMTFRDKAGYGGPFDDAGVPLLDYHGSIGPQYNPIAIAQYGLAHINRYVETKEARHRDAFLAQADWLVENLRPNQHGAMMWMHDFDWEYREGLKAPWYSGLAQGQGISCLVRAHQVTDQDNYLEAAEHAFEALRRPIDEGGTCFVDERGDIWIEEYIVDPPSHILNGYLWALWGVHDLALATGAKQARDLFDEGSQTILKNLHVFDTGWWSLYDAPDGRLRNPASPFYHKLHITQLRVMHRLTGDPEFEATAQRWEAYQERFLNRKVAFANKVLFKLLRY